MGEIIFWIVLIALNVFCIINNIKTERSIGFAILNTFAAGACVVCLCAAIKDYRNPEYQQIIKTHNTPVIDTVFTKSNNNIDTLYIYKFPKQ